MAFGFWLLAFGFWLSSLTANSQQLNANTQQPIANSQTYHLRKEHDSLYWLNDWRLPYPVYRFETGDVDGDGREDAMVGVVKATRYYPEQGRRLFIFKQVDNSRQPDGQKKVRPLWLGSKLGGRLEDFRYVGQGHIRSLETTDAGQYVVADYRWGGFGMTFDHYLIKGTNQTTALKLFNQ